jgi:hypothetical protein
MAAEEARLLAFVPGLGVVAPRVTKSQVDPAEHVVSGDVLSSQLYEGEQVPTIEGSDVNVSITLGHVFINDAAVLQAEMQASNVGRRSESMPCACVHCSYVRTYTRVPKQPTMCIMKEANAGKRVQTHAKGSLNERHSGAGPCAHDAKAAKLSLSIGV